MAKKEFQKPSAEMSSRSSPSDLPIISRQAPVRYRWISAALGIAPQPNQSSMKRE